MVMQVCKVYLRSACGDTLDTYKGENYDVQRIFLKNSSDFYFSW